MYGLQNSKAAGDNGILPCMSKVFYFSVDICTIVIQEERIKIAWMQK